MKRDFLEGLGLEKDIVDAVMKEHGKTVQSVKPDDYEELKEKSSLADQQIAKLEEKLASIDEEYKSFENEKLELNEKVRLYETKELKQKVARKHKLPFDLADRLSGETEEELNADAESLSSLISKQEVLPLKTQQEESNKDQAYLNLLNK